MLVVVSPAKRLDENTPKLADATRPVFRSAAHELVKVCQHLTPAQLEKRMGISPDLAKLNADRFARFGTNTLRPAVHLFSGDTYSGLEAQTLDPAEMAYAQDHLRILSGLYGLLRPLDNIKAHRLEMGTRLATAKGKNLYEFWAGQIASELNRVAKNVGAKMLVNCASVEYFKAVDQTVIAPEIVTPKFMENHVSGPRVTAFYAKKARGAMARFIVQHRITDINALNDFDSGGYRYDAALSQPGMPVFLR